MRAWVEKLCKIIKSEGKYRVDSSRGIYYIYTNRFKLFLCVGQYFYLHLHDMNTDYVCSDIKLSKKEYHALREAQHVCENNTLDSLINSIIAYKECK